MQRDEDTVMNEISTDHGNRVQYLAEMGVGIIYKYPCMYIMTQLNKILWRESKG